MPVCKMLVCFHTPNSKDRKKYPESFCKETDKQLQNYEKRTCGRIQNFGTVEGKLQFCFHNRTKGCCLAVEWWSEIKNCKVLKCRLRFTKRSYVHEFPNNIPEWSENGWFVFFLEIYIQIHCEDQWFSQKLYAKTNIIWKFKWWSRRFIRLEASKEDVWRCTGVTLGFFVRPWRQPSD